MRQPLPIVVILCSLIFISCNDNGTGPQPESSQEIPTYDVNVTVSPTDAGSVSPSSQDSYEEGEEVELRAQANEGYVFTGWSGDVESSDNPYTLTVDQNYTLKANFELKSYELSVNTQGEGTVSEQILEQQSKDYDHGTVVELTASPAEGYKFVEWTGDVTDTQNHVQITVDSPQEVTAVFEKKSFGLTMTTSGEGTVVLNPDQQEFLYNSTVELEANPAQGWSFVEWEGDISGTDTLFTVTVDTAKTITAVFENNFAGGEGTNSNPYKIATLKQLQKIVNTEFASAHFIQINDIDASATANWNNGKGFEPIYFQGSYDGQGHVISNLTIDRDDTNAGLFGRLQSGEIRNLAVENVDITGGRFTGGLVGIASSGSQIHDSYTTGKVHCTAGRCAGLVGDNYGTIKNSFANVEVTSIADDVGGLVGMNWGRIENSFAKGNATGINDVGGLVGSQIEGNSSSGTIIKSYAQGQVTGKENLGGLVGSTRANTWISYSYATGKVSESTASAATSIGGLVGRFNSSSTLSVCYWDTEGTGQVEARSGTGGNDLVGLTTAEMTGSDAQTNMPEFDFVSIWQTVDGDYPALFWE